MLYFFSDDMGLVNADLNNASLDEDNFDNNGLETIIHDRLMIWCNRYKQFQYQQFQFPSSVSFFIPVICRLGPPVQSTSTNSAHFLDP